MIQYDTLLERIFQLCFYLGVFFVLLNIIPLSISGKDITWLLISAIISFMLVNTFYPTTAVPCNIDKYKKV